MSRSAVLFPQPLGPSSATHSPSLTARLRSLRIQFWPKRRPMDLSSSIIL